MGIKDPILRLLISSSLGLAIALNLVDGTSVLTVSNSTNNYKPQDVFFGLVIFYFLVAGTVLVHILVHEKTFTRCLSIFAILLAFSFTPFPYIYNFPKPYAIISPIIVAFSIPVPFLLRAG